MDNITVEYLERIRKLVSGSSDNPRALHDSLLARKEYAKVPRDAINKLVRAARAPDFLWSKFREGEISYTALREIIDCKLDDTTAKMLLDDVMEHKMGRPAIGKFRAAYKEHRPYCECINAALGKIESGGNGSGNGHAEAKRIEDLASEVARDGTRLRARAEMIYTIAPDNKSAESVMVFAAFYHMRQALKDMLAYIDGKIMAQLDKSQGEQSPRIQEVTYAAREGEGGGAEGGGRPASEAVADVADQPRQDRGA